jgi:hypothetical protein
MTTWLKKKKEIGPHDLFVKISLPYNNNSNSNSNNNDEIID